jgi:hypothetical protein
MREGGLMDREDLKKSFGDKDAYMESLRAETSASILRRLEEEADGGKSLATYKHMLEWEWPIRRIKLTDFSKWAYNSPLYAQLFWARVENIGLGRFLRQRKRKEES